MDIISRSRSSSTSSSFSSGSPPTLDPDVLALLNAHLADKAEEEARFKALEAAHVAAQLAGLDVSDDDDGDEKPMVSLPEYKKAFGEDWQLSQFWYSNTFATHLSTLLHTLCTPTTKIAFLCSPTAFVAFQHMNQLPGAYLFEFDTRFAVLAPKHFVRYDLDEPDDVPEKFKDFFDVIIADPPFLNEVTNRKLKTTLEVILKKTPDSKLLLLTSTSVEDVLDRVYTSPPLGPLKKTAMEVEHGQLANDFACYGNWEGAERFG